MLGLVMGILSFTMLVAVGLFLKDRRSSNPRMVFFTTVSLSIVLFLGGTFVLFTTSPASAQQATTAATPLGQIAAVAAALSTGLACIGAGIAVGNVGSAALGLIGEKPDMMGRTLIYVALAEGIAIYGMLISILIMFR